MTKQESNIVTVFWELTENDGSTGGMSQELIDRMLALGGDWYNTEYGFESSDHIALGYNGSYLSLNTLIDGFIDIPEVVIEARPGDFGEGSYNSLMMERAFENSAMQWNLSQARGSLYDAIANTQVGQSVTGFENLLFYDVPQFFVGGSLFNAGWKAIGAGKYLSGIVNNLYARVAPKILANFEQAAVHGNSLKSLRPTWGYKLYSVDGTFLKNGITSAVKAESRYTKKFMEDKFMEKFPFPNRLEAWKWEFQQNQILRGPLNKSMH
ncbi:hypothetical protein [Chryseobacterium taihuense]|uniref:Uncharacterized protein n=1 Tax=Chryseobacterium taihuense TaxID=1141221 RepID=A0ABY0QZT4_9FLAO|nr:hypothetical protein [Chryseobacterium taihuense]SDM14687.1 hypothetical protein SAMN05216273_11497 [Chryseobacterium taihuense]